MAAATCRYCFNIHLVVSSFLFFLVLISQIHGIHLSLSDVEVVNIDGTNYLDKRDNYAYSLHHRHKRDSNNPPIKKASAASEKKPFGKTPTAEIPLHAKSEVPVENTTDNATTTNATSTAFVFSTLGSNAANKYNVSLSTAPTGLEASSSNVTSTTAVLASSTASTTTTVAPTTSNEFPEIPDVLPTRPSSIQNETEDHHVYYNSTTYLLEDKAMSYWVNFDDLPAHKVIVHTMLSHSHRRAATVNLTFDFPFYGHLLRNITIATGGFVYTGDYMHSWLAATQYIAPLMANFDTSLHTDSIVRYFDNGTAFVIEWNEVTLQDERTGGNFTFQATLLNNGNIIFVYKTIPSSVLEIEDLSHPVKVGLSDAYVIDRMVFYIRRKTIYEYHKIDMKNLNIRNGSAIYFTALTTCLGYKDCNSCMSNEIGLQCVWCNAAKKCSDGLDRYRQQWLQLGCDHEKIVDCNASSRSDINPNILPYTDSSSKTYTINTPSSMPEPHNPTYKPGRPSYSNDDGASTSARVAEDTSSMGVGSVVAILLILAIVMGSMVWVGYAYRNPHTFSGQLLIRYRPSQWRFRSGEARYTAASVHM